MRKIILLSLAVATVAAACDRTPAEPESGARAGSSIQADNNPGDSAAARGGNLMGSGH